jgi:hypothetical protein
MARGALTVYDSSRDGVQCTMTAADDTDGHYFVNDGRTIILAQNTGGASTLTFQTPGTVDSQAVGDRDVAVNIHATLPDAIGPFPPGVYNQSDGTVYIDVDDDTTLSLMALRIPA